MSRECNSISFKLTAVAVAEARSYLFPSIASGCDKRRFSINASLK